MSDVVRNGRIIVQLLAFMPSSPSCLFNLRLAQFVLPGSFKSKKTASNKEGGGGTVVVEARQKCKSYIMKANLLRQYCL